jgi:beta-galactosidase
MMDFATPQQAYLKTVWNKETTPYVCVRPVTHTGEAHTPSIWRLTNALESWTWNGCEDKKAEVEIFSTATVVELLVNGRSAGKKKCGAKKAYKALFKAVFQPGEFAAVSYDNNDREIGRKTLRTAYRREFCGRGTHHLSGPGAGRSERRAGGGYCEGDNYR